MLLTGEPEHWVANANRASTSIALIAVNPRIRTGKLPSGPKRLGKPNAPQPSYTGKFLSLSLRRVLTSSHATVVE